MITLRNSWRFVHFIVCDGNPVGTAIFGIARNISLDPQDHSIFHQFPCWHNFSQVIMCTAVCCTPFNVITGQLSPSFDTAIKVRAGVCQPNWGTVSTSFYKSPSFLLPFSIILLLNAGKKGKTKFIVPFTCKA